MNTSSCPNAATQCDQVAADVVAQPLPKLNLRPGELVKVRDISEILATLDSEGRLESIPFMPEMLPYCGQQFRVFKRADNTCAGGAPRNLQNAVHLDQLRCNGSAHQGCQARCLVLWKEAWLERVQSGGSSNRPQTTFATRDLVAADSWLKTLTEHPCGKVVCQATELCVATGPVDLGSPPCYARDVVTSLLARKIGLAELHGLLRWISGWLIRGIFFLRLRVRLSQPAAGSVPEEKLNLQPGEVVEVRSKSEILRTLNSKGAHRGLQFKPEMFAFCEGRYRVLGRIDKRVNERSAQITQMKNECILLDSVYCQGQLHFCTRSNYHYWREVWLRRVASDSGKHGENGGRLVQLRG